MLPMHLYICSNLGCLCLMQMLLGAFIIVVMVVIHHPTPPQMIKQQPSVVSCRVQSCRDAESYNAMMLSHTMP